jgi:hypothetical protein
MVTGSIDPFQRPLTQARPARQQQSFFDCRVQFFPILAAGACRGHFGPRENGVDRCAVIH